MNTFQRGERFQGHLISALPNRYVCAECHSQLIYACDDVCEKISCVKHPEHNGLVKIEDVMLVNQEHMLAKGVELYNLLSTNPIELAIFRANTKKSKSALFGDDND